MDDDTQRLQPVQPRVRVSVWQHGRPDPVVLEVPSETPFGVHQNSVLQVGNRWFHSVDFHEVAQLTD